MMSVMSFDAPGSESIFLTNLFVYSQLTFPVVIIIAIIGSWIFYRKNKHKEAIILNFLPILNITLAILAFLLLEIFCEGRFAC